MIRDVSNPKGQSVPEIKAEILMAEWQSVSMFDALKRHWQVYLLEAVGLGIFMVSACGFAVLLFHPASFAGGMIEGSLIKQMLMGVAMGLTFIGIVYSPIGQKSGAHINPAATLMFYRLGKINGYDALWYVLAQFIGGVLGVVLSSAVFGKLLAHQSVNYVVTVPGDYGVTVAFIAETAISMLLMIVVLTVSNTKRLSNYTGLIVGFLVATYIAFENPLSGMSMNPARTFGSALVGNVWNGLWIYFIASPAGMLLAAEIYTRACGMHSVLCAKLNHSNHRARCIFRCNFYGETING